MKRTWNIAVSWWILITVLAPGWAMGADPEDEAASIPELPTVEVETRQADRSKSVTVITKDNMEGTHGTNMNDFLFSGTPGISTSRRSDIGFSGPNAGFHIRGLNGPRVAVFVDGIPQQVNNHFHPRSDQYSSDLIDRMEITRGPSVLLHGPSAVGGVIDIFTRRPSEGLSGYVQGAYGELDTHEILGDMSYGWKSGSILLSGTDRETDGQALGEGHDERNLHLKLTQQINENWTAGFRASNTREFASDARSSDPNEVIFKFTQDLTTFVFSLDRKTESSNSLIAIHYNDLDTGSFRESGAAGIFNQNDRIETETGILGKHTWLRGAGDTLTVGFNAVEYTDENPEGSTEQDESYISPYIHGSQTITKNIRADGGVRVTHSSQFGTDVSPEAGLVATIDSSLALRARGGTAFRVPRVDEVVNNRQLEPEEFVHAEVGLNKTFGNKAEFDIALWYMDGDNLIVNDINIGEFEHYGVEAFLNVQLTNYLALSLGAAAMDLEDTANVPQHTFDVGLEFRHGRWRANLAARYAGDNARTTLDDYFVADARLSFALAKDLEVFVDVDNLTDEKFATFQGGFGGPVENIPRVVLGGIRYRWAL